MSDDRFNGHYIKVLNNTISETVLRNIHMQAQAEFVDQLIGEMTSENESLRKQIEEMGVQLQEKINEIARLHTIKSESDNVKNQLQHLDTFRNELLREREEHANSLKKIEELEEKISVLTAPAKTKVKKTLFKPEIVTDENAVRDGATF